MNNDRLLAKWLTTVVTSIWFLSCMSSNMFLQISLPAKWLTTVVTSIWFLSCMSYNMATQIPLLTKWFTTVVTSIWFFSCMSSNMFIMNILFAKWRTSAHKHIVSLMQTDEYQLQFIALGVGDSRLNGSALRQRPFAVLVGVRYSVVAIHFSGDVTYRTLFMWAIRCLGPSALVAATA